MKGSIGPFILAIILGVLACIFSPIHGSWNMMSTILAAVLIAPIWLIRRG